VELFESFDDRATMFIRQTKFLSRHKMLAHVEFCWIARSTKVFTTIAATYVFHPRLIVKTAIQDVTVRYIAIVLQLQLCHLVHAAVNYTVLYAQCARLCPHTVDATSVHNT